MTNQDSFKETTSLPELADELQCHKQTLFKIAKRLEIIPTKKRDTDRRNQLVSVISTAEAALIRRELLLRPRTGISTGVDETLISEDGIFYLIQLEPEHDPGRIKLGFTTDLYGRLQKHKCSAPFAICLKTWPCRRTWERAAMDCVAVGLEQLHTEVFRAASIHDVQERADRFFAMMPSVAVEDDEEDSSVGQ